MALSLSQIAFFLHLIVEIPASVKFFLQPSATLATPQPQAHGLVRQYALLLVSSNLIAAEFVLRPSDQLSRHIAGALALYHIGPLFRAISRIRRAEMGGGMGGPWLHAVVHALCAMFLLASFALV